MGILHHHLIKVSNFTFLVSFEDIKDIPKVNGLLEVNNFKSKVNDRRVIIHIVLALIRLVLIILGRVKPELALIRLEHVEPKLGLIKLVVIKVSEQFIFQLVDIQLFRQLSLMGCIQYICLDKLRGCIQFDIQLHNNQ